MVVEAMVAGRVKRRKVGFTLLKADCIVLMKKEAAAATALNNNGKRGLSPKKPTAASLKKARLGGPGSGTCEFGYDVFGSYSLQFCHPVILTS